ncbi:2-hydroxychromene-2-carboxylate isomerase [Thalassospira mesophila]|uniref:2-hydroxychromene-2-carboxylate isomerase n=1 Tax=Thalassospira mesophila TaxID=1293891 RepID=A0A1Y2L0C2_9PROT|nr:2-hydroxychromene-2-carboxylate isomerase [Thalassospira mesophila]OSQ37165.1 DSBA oxidoreductase [Thalassospira mesophila]
MSRIITHYFFVQSPWAFFGIRRAIEIAARHNAKIDHRPVKSSEIFKHGGGVPLKQRPVPRQAYRMVELKRWRSYLDIPLNETPEFFPINESLAAGTIIAAKLDGQDVSNLIETIMRDIWVNQRDAASPDVIAAALHHNGLSSDYLELAGDGAVLDTYDAYTEDAKTANIFGVPTYFLGDEMFWGQDRLEFVERALATQD